MAATLDHLSGGRLILGIGAGWHDPEYEAFGYPTDHKVGRFEESLTVITSLIRDGRADLDADAWNVAWFGLPDERLGRIRGELCEACERVSRDPATLQDTVGVLVRYPTAGRPSDDDPPASPALSGTPTEIAAGLAAHAAAGAGHVIAALEPCTPATLTEFAEAVALYRQGAPAAQARRCVRRSIR